MKKVSSHIVRGKHNRSQSKQIAVSGRSKKYMSIDVQRLHSIPEVDTVSVLKLIHTSKKPLKFYTIMKLLELPKDAKNSLKFLLNMLQEQGHIASLGGGKWVNASQVQQVTGIFSIQRSGAAFVLVDQNSNGPSQPDIFIPFELQKGAWDGDHVRVILKLNSRPGKSPEGQVVQILNRPRKEAIVRVSRQVESNGVVCSSADPKINAIFVVDVSQLPQQPIENDLLLVVPDKTIHDGMVHGVAKSLLGAEKDVQAQEKIVKISYGIPLEFPPEVLEEGYALEQKYTAKKQSLESLFGFQYKEGISKTSTHIRQDLRKIAFVTIDGEDAKDFDDAICVYPTSDGWELWVAIADVSHFVKMDSLLDREALARGNSYYFPTSVEPMLPEVLSNGLCSLNPHEDKMVMATRIFVDKHGKVNGATFFPGVICSRARLTYKQVQLALDNEYTDSFAEFLVDVEIVLMLNHAVTLAKALQKCRIDRGSLEFDLPEACFLVDQLTGQVTGVVRQEHFFSHQLIEECMLAANEAVARFLTEKQIPFLYRIHPEPDHERLEKLFRTLATTHLAQNLSIIPEAKKLKEILEQAEHTPQAFLISRMVLRSMMQAKYTPDQGEHFGLASLCYCHFTSPIRRYADLVVHRALKVALGGTHGSIVYGEKLFTIADQCNIHERTAQDAEREIAKRLNCLILQEYEGETFEAIVTGLTEFLFFIELTSMPVEGVVRLSSLKYDWFEYNQDRQELIGVRTGKRFCLGQNIQVRLVSVNILRLEVEFEVIEKYVTKTKKRKRNMSGVSHS